MYKVELQDPPNGFIVYKVSDNGESDIAYKVELHHYAENAHRCSCAHGEKQKYLSGKTMARCKHITMCLDVLNKESV